MLCSIDGGWSSAMLEQAGIDPERLPKIFGCPDIVGNTHGEFARQTGIDGVPVVAGASFEQSSALGIGAVKPGLICDIISFVEPVCTVVRDKFLDKTRLLETRAWCEQGSWFAENPGFVSGGSYKWLRDNFGKLEMIETADTLRTAYDLLNEQAGRAPAGSGGVIFFPFLSGSMAPEWNRHARGMITGFTLDHTRNHIIRAVLEGAAYALRDVIDCMKESGLAVDEIRVVGGGSRSTLMEEIRANVTGVTVAHSNVFDTAAYGAALIAAAGEGTFASPSEAAEACVRIVRRFEPDEETKKLYDIQYSNYRTFFDKLKDDFEGLWGVAMPLVKEEKAKRGELEDEE